MARDICYLCSNDLKVRKVKIQVLPWRYECLYLCSQCLPRLKEATQMIRDALLQD